jgi:cellulose synthase/poly-beta-1,6-N-acetylglucosamine synthase-like glycosyltransferase
MRALGTVEWVFFAYFVGLQLMYFTLVGFAIPRVVRHVRSQALDHFPQHYSELDPPVSIVVPAWNESATVVTSVRALLDLRYGEYEVIVVNDGSTDDTMAQLVEAFDLQPAPIVPHFPCESAPVTAMWVSGRHANLRVVEKVNGGSKADANNAGVNVARYPLVCCVDADSILDPDALRVTSRPFVDDPSTVAVGASVRIANGCSVEGGRMVRSGLPRNWFARFQVIEYLRSFLCGRMGWSGLNAVLIVSGAFGVFRRDVLMAVGGYRHDAIAEDIDLVTRIHIHMGTVGERYRIAFVPDPVCWTEAPEDVKSLGRQRTRWHRGLGQTMKLNRALAFRRGTGLAGWLAFPFFFLFECMGPLIELTGTVYLTWAACVGALNTRSFVAYMVLVFASSLLFSASAIVLEDVSYRVYRRRGDLLRLFGYAVAENFGYRQLNTVWRVVGLFQWLSGRKSQWKPIARTGSWQTALPAAAPSD